MQHKSPWLNLRIASDSLIPKDSHHPDEFSLRIEISNDGCRIGSCTVSALYRMFRLINGMNFFTTLPGIPSAKSVFVHLFELGDVSLEILSLQPHTMDTIYGYENRISIKYTKRH